MGSSKVRLRGARFLYLAPALLLFLFVVYSAPHLVHHAFSVDLANPCLAFSFAKACQLKQTPKINLSVIPIPTEAIPSSLAAWIPSLTPSPFSKRAPPLS